MDAAAQWAAAGAPDGAALVADHQSAGRGRHGRSWETPAGAAIALSLVLRPRIDPARAAQVAMGVGLGALEGLEGAIAQHGERDGSSLEGGAIGPDAGPALGLKWPNDLVAARSGAAGRYRKLGGLLAEATWRGGEAVIIVGLGINVDQVGDALPPGATSLAALGVPAERRQRQALVDAVLAGVDRRYAALSGGADLVRDWSARLVTLGRKVVVQPVAGASADGEPMAGRAVGVTMDGALRVVDAEGAEHVVRAQDVTLAGGW